ncbi:MAG: DUF4215 domain-containing protein, partial [Myxococcota bacterium]|nr:DUF4215 domain-containing protein [Myxococcota bacterium]
MSRKCLVVLGPLVLGLGTWGCEFDADLSPDRGAFTAGADSAPTDCRNDDLGCRMPFGCLANDEGVFACRMVESDSDDVLEPAMAPNQNPEGGTEADEPTGADQGGEAGDESALIDEMADATSACGNGRIDEGEECDDGNTVSEPCPEGVAECMICAADCTTQWAGDLADRRQSRGADVTAVDPIGPCLPPRPLDAAGSTFVFTALDAMREPLALSAVLSTISQTGGGPADEAAQRALMQTMLDAFGVDRLVNPASGLALPIQVRPTEANLDVAQFIADMHPVAVLNRLDLASSSGADCGEHRMVFALAPNSALKTVPFQKFTLIFEARYPNPNPEAGLAGCLPIAAFWAGLPQLEDDATRAAALRAAFIEGITFEGTVFPPVVHVDHFRNGMGQVRTDQFIDSPWQLREFRTAIDDERVVFDPATARGNPLGVLYNEGAANAAGLGELRSAFIDDLLQHQLPRLLRPELENIEDPSAMLVSFEPLFDERFSGFTSNSQGIDDDPLSQASPDLIEALAGELDNLGVGDVSPEHILNRLGASTCGGCHEFSGSRAISRRLNWPGKTQGFTHIDDDGTLSEPMIAHFLPQRKQAFEARFMCEQICGDGRIDQGEACDDGNTDPGDGCDAQCEVEAHWVCNGTPSRCDGQCGDGFIRGDEVCDDGNTQADDGCSVACQVDPAWACSRGEPSVCDGVCGDGLSRGFETCDDGNRNDDDGCSLACLVERGFTCEGEPSRCIAGCGAPGQPPCDADGDGVP